VCHTIINSNMAQPWNDPNPVTTNSSVKASTLWRMHAGAAIAHGAQFAYGEYLVNTTYKGEGIFAITNPVATFRGQPPPDGGLIGTFQLSQLVPVFSGLSMINHLWAITRWEDYKGYVGKGYNPVRWAEYAISAGLMTFSLGSMSGIEDIKTLMALVIGNAAMQYTGYGSEVAAAQALNHKNKIDTTFAADTSVRHQVEGFAVFAAQLVVLWTAFGTAVTRAEGSPDFLWAIMTVITALYLSFGLLSLTYTLGAVNKANDTLGTFELRDFGKVELGFTGLSLAAKSFLLNMVLFGSIMSRSDQEEESEDPFTEEE